MWVSRVIIEDIKAFEDTTEIALDRKMNVLIGENNAGKSIIIKAISLLQYQGSLSIPDIRYGKQRGGVALKLEEVDEIFHGVFHYDGNYMLETHCEFDNNTGNNSGSAEYYATSHSNEKVNIGAISSQEPNNFIYPFLSKRKVGGFLENVNLSNTLAVNENLQFLVSKIDRISDPTYAAYDEYRKACIEIIGFPISAYPSPGGHRAGISLGNFGNIPLEAMGDGVPNLLGLITDLCIAENKLFLIEEIENDIHPKALKSLLSLIISKTDTNQFVITTHSNIVAKYLGSIEDSKLHHIGRDPEARIPTAIYREVANSTEERRAVLEELGYEMTDYDLWKGWLILEESSAESIISDFLIPTFARNLEGKLRTIAAHGISQVAPKFEDFNRLFLFAHLERNYKNRAWVVVDNGPAGRETIESLTAKYAASGWDKGCFIKLTKNDFEEYYPEDFKEEVEAVLKIADKKKKREAKKNLLDKVLAWIEVNRDEAAKKFEISAKEIIEVLKAIDEKLS